MANEENRDSLVVSETLLHAVETLGGVGQTLVKIGYSILVMVAGGAFGVGWFFASMSKDVQSVDNRLAVLTDVNTDVSVRLRKVEDAVAPGVLKKAATEIENNEKEIDELRERLGVVERIMESYR